MRGLERRSTFILLDDFDINLLMPQFVSRILSFNHNFDSSSLMRPGGLTAPGADIGALLFNLNRRVAQAKLLFQ